MHIIVNFCRASTVFAHFSRRLKWAFLITCCPSSFCPSVLFGENANICTVLYACRYILLNLWNMTTLNKEWVYHCIKLLSVLKWKWLFYYICCCFLNQEHPYEQFIFSFTLGYIAYHIIIILIIFNMYHG